MESLKALGWNDEYADKWRRLEIVGLQPARVVADFGTSLKVALPSVCAAELSGKMAHHSNREDIPKVGDWVGVRLLDNSPAVIEAIVPRSSELARKVTGNRTVRQVIAANVDVAFVLQALDDDFNIARLKRYLYQLSVSHIRPIIVLNKSDKTDDAAAYVGQLHELGHPIITSIATEGKGVPAIMEHIAPGETAILLGSSGVGKSTLTNHLLGREVQETQAVRQSDSTGKHTTVHRELFVLPNGGLLIDTPGIRELQLWGTEEELDENFDDVAALIAMCKFSTCRHQSEPGCAVREAIEHGKLSTDHYAAYQKMKGELVGLKVRNQERQRHDNRRSAKGVKRQDAASLREMHDELD